MMRRKKGTEGHAACHPPVWLSHCVEMYAMLYKYFLQLSNGCTLFMQSHTYISHNMIYCMYLSYIHTTLHAPPPPSPYVLMQSSLMKQDFY